VNSLIVDGDLITALINGGSGHGTQPVLRRWHWVELGYDLAFDFGQIEAGCRRASRSSPIVRETSTFAADLRWLADQLRYRAGQQRSRSPCTRDTAGTDTQIGTVSISTSNVITYASTGGLAQSVDPQRGQLRVHRRPQPAGLARWLACRHHPARARSRP